MSYGEKPTPIVCRPPDDFLGIDPDKDFNEEALSTARDALEGRHRKSFRRKLMSRFKCGGWRQSIRSSKGCPFSIAFLTTVLTPSTRWTLGDEVPAVSSSAHASS